MSESTSFDLSKLVDAWRQKAIEEFQLDASDADDCVFKTEQIEYNDNAFTWLVKHGVEIPHWIAFRQRFEALSEAQQNLVAIVLCGGFPFPETLINHTVAQSILIARGELDDDLNMLTSKPIKRESV